MHVRVERRARGDETEAQRTVDYANEDSDGHIVRNNELHYSKKRAQHSSSERKAKLSTLTSRL